LSISHVSQGGQSNRLGTASAAPGSPAMGVGLTGCRGRAGAQRPLAHGPVFGCGSAVQGRARAGPRPWAPGEGGQRQPGKTGKPRPVPSIRGGGPSAHGPRFDRATSGQGNARWAWRKAGHGRPNVGGGAGRDGIGRWPEVPDRDHPPRPRRRAPRPEARRHNCCPQVFSGGQGAPRSGPPSCPRFLSGRVRGAGVRTGPACTQRGPSGFHLRQRSTLRVEGGEKTEKKKSRTVASSGRHAVDGGGAFVAPSRPAARSSQVVLEEHFHAAPVLVGGVGGSLSAASAAW